MATFKLPELGENIETAEVTRLLVKPGDVIKADQSVMELDSEKASFPLPCPTAGKISKIHVKEGQTIKIGQPLLDVEEAGTPASREPEKSPKEKAPAAVSKPSRREPQAPAPSSAEADTPGQVPPPVASPANSASTC